MVVLSTEVSRPRMERRRETGAEVEGCVRPVTAYVWWMCCCSYEREREGFKMCAALRNGSRKINSFLNEMAARRLKTQRRGEKVTMKAADIIRPTRRMVSLPRSTWFPVRAPSKAGALAKWHTSTHARTSQSQFWRAKQNGEDEKRQAAIFSRHTATGHM
jgi:hypothetical protein